jgi:Ca-activated chloride channel family protein
MQLQFENHAAFWGLFGVLFISGLMVWNYFRAPASFSARRFVVGTLAFLFCVLALARPQLGHQVTHKRGMRGNLFIAVDISRSMLAPDVIPSRLGFSLAFAQKVLQGVTGIRVALFPFALDGYMMIPLTTDLNMASDMLSTLQPGLTTNQGTDISDSLEQLFQQIMKMENGARDRGEDWPPSQVLLLSDGESHYPVSSSVLGYYRAQHIPIFTVTVGTTTGSTLPMEGRFGRRDAVSGDGLREPSGRAVLTKASPETMRKISHETGGDWFSPELTQAPRAAGKIMQSMQLGKLTSSFKVDKEYYPWLLVLACCLFTLELALGRWDYAIRALLVPALLLLGTASSAARAEDPTAIPAAAPTETPDPSVRAVDAYNEGLSFLASKDLNKAAEAFQEASGLTKDLELRKKALYNLGNTFMHMMDPGQAIQAYQAARDVVTKRQKFNQESNQRISENLLLAVQMEEKLKQMAQQQQQQQGGQGDKEQQPNDPNGPQKDYVPQTFDEKQKQRMYDLMASEEQQIIQRLQQEKSKRPQTRTTDKPW